MSFDITATVEAMQTAIAAITNTFSGVDIDEPVNPVATGPYVVLYPESMHVVEVTLNGTVERHVIRVKIFRGQDGVTLAERVLEGPRLTSQLIDALLADIDFTGDIRSIDVAGIYGAGIEAQFGDTDLSGTPYRLADITIPVIVDGAAVIAA